MRVERAAYGRPLARALAAIAAGMFVFSAIAFVPDARASVAEDLAAADTAFDAGDTARAQTLYERVLAREPGNVRALVRSAQMLSWVKEYDEAVGRYDQALAADPGNRFARLERAKVLSWSGLYDAAADGFRRILAESPDDREARLGLARSLSWGRRQSEARAEYEEVLKRAPGDLDALLGVAQTWAWSGDSVRARPYYERVLAADPDSKDARVGLANLDLQDGHVYRAARDAAALAKSYPGDGDIAALAATARRARAPWIRVSFERTDDRDDVAVDLSRIEGGLTLPARLDLRGGLARWDLAAPAPPRGTIDSVWAALGWAPRGGHRLEARAGVDGTKDSSGASDDVFIGGLSYRFPVAGSWSGRVAWDRDTFRYSPAILDDRIVIDAYAANVDGRIRERWRVAAGAGLWDLSDGNARSSFDAGAWYAFKPEPVTIETGYQFRRLDYDRGTRPGGTIATSYFAPQGLAAHALQARARGPLRGPERGYWDVGVETGVQSFTRSGAKVSNDVFFGADALLGIPLGSAVVLEAFGAYSSYAQQGGGNWRYRQLGLRLRWTIGG
jgi:tetratricopeptide (TPR) repeat protein